MAGNCKKPRSSVFRCAEPRVPLATAQNHARHATERLDVVDHRRAAVEPHHGGERRTDTRVTALALERLHQCRLFAAFIGARAGVCCEVEIEATAEYVLAQVAPRVSLRDGLLNDVDYVAILAADINVSLMRSYRPPRDDHPFDQLVRIHFEQRTVFTSSRLTFIPVRENIFRLAGILWNEAPLHSRRKARSAPATQIRFLHLLDDLVGCHLRQGFFSCLITLVLQINVNPPRVGNSEAPADHWHLGRMPFV